MQLSVVYKTHLMAFLCVDPESGLYFGNDLVESGSEREYTRPDSEFIDEDWELDD